MKYLNRRRIIRHRSLLPVKVSIRDADNWVESNVLNCHKNGVCLLSELPCTPGDNLEVLAFDMAEKIPATVVWCRPTKDLTETKNMFKVGVQYSL